jgi:hypothetical protein
MKSGDPLKVLELDVYDQIRNVRIKKEEDGYTRKKRRPSRVTKKNLQEHNSGSPDGKYNTTPDERDDSFRH